MKFTKITKGIYGKKESGFYIEIDNTLEGEMKWVVRNIDCYFEERYFLDTQNDQLFATLTEAKESLVA